MSDHEADPGAHDGADAGADGDAAELDALGLRCPLPVLKLRKRLAALPVGGRLRMLADDPAALIDVPHFCAEQGHRLIAQRDLCGADGASVLVFVVEKAERPRQA